MLSLKYRNSVADLGQIGQAGECTFTKVSIAGCPLGVAPGLDFMVSVKITNPLEVSQPIKTYVYAVGDKSGETTVLLDISQNFPAGTYVYYASEIYTMPEEPVTIYAVSYIWYNNEWVWECYKTKNVVLRAKEVRYWLTVAQGNSWGELEVDGEGRYGHRNVRVVVETAGMPSWMLKSVDWFINVSLWPLKAINMDIVDVKIEGSVSKATMYIYLYEKPAAFQLAILIPVLAAIFAGFVVWRVSQVKIQQQVTEQLKTELQIAETKAAATQAIIDYSEKMINEGHPELAIPPEEMGTLVDSIWDSGYDFQKDGADWKTYLKWGLIGAGGILVAGFVVPRIIESTKK